MAMDRVIIGVDPHKLSVTIEARDNREILRATGRFGTDARSHRQLLQLARQWPERIWAVEGAKSLNISTANAASRGRTCTNS
jgi:transposase